MQNLFLWGVVVEVSQREVLGVKQTEVGVRHGAFGVRQVPSRMNISSWMWIYLMILCRGKYRECVMCVIEVIYYILVIRVISLVSYVHNISHILYIGYYGYYCRVFMRIIWS